MYFDPNNLPTVPSFSLGSNLDLSKLVAIQGSMVSVCPGDWVVLDSTSGFVDKINRDLFQVCGVCGESQICILYSLDGSTYSSINLSSSLIMFILRTQ